MFQTRGFRDPSPERCDETVPEERIHREKRRDSSDSSLVQPAYGREELLLRETTIGQVTSEDQTTHISKKAKKHKQPASSTTDGTQSESDQPQRKETFDKGSRHKTKEDRYEFKKTRQHVAEDDKPAKKKTIKVKRGDAAKASRKAGEDLINGFRSKNVAQDRLTVCCFQCEFEIWLILGRCVPARAYSRMAERHLLLGAAVVSMTEKLDYSLLTCVST